VDVLCKSASGVPFHFSFQQTDSKALSAAKRGLSNCSFGNYGQEFAYKTHRAAQFLRKREINSDLQTRDYSDLQPKIKVETSGLDETEHPSTREKSDRTVESKRTLA
jgi:hypothetical protein